MPSFADSVFLFFLALLLFGPKKLPELARQLGKLMAEFRRASNEFKYQMEEELRLSEQAEERKKLAEQAKEAGPEAVKPIATEGEVSIMPPSTGLPTPAGSSETEASTSADPATQTEADAVSALVDSVPVEAVRSETIGAEPILSEPIPQIPSELDQHLDPAHTHTTQETHG
ncbi:sec-independent translocation protein MttA [Terriglobus albidus]|uniref:Sec-independent translocation protein MttA n=1 Tax=Terriglobus albidus TaxID=1592106 RepID=A0A5B9ECA8_9BACT|nr:twin-arginine translocase TatA/TatE family subunit [Terriglobus albidus]QEE27656.1 sec-independent translocation protein MttA [Terriglobus albidus]